MKIHEYQAKEILSKFNVPVQQGIIATNGEEAVAAYKKLSTEIGVIKAQVHAGGRGKGGGVKLVHNEEEAKKITEEMLSKPLVTPQTGPEGVKVKKVLVCEKVNIEKEYYLSMIVDRNYGPIIIASSEGGMEIEEVAKKYPEKIIKEKIDINAGIYPFQIKKIGYSLGFNSKNELEIVEKLLKGIVKTFFTYDCSLVEINPLVKTKEGDIFGLDAKIVFDDNGLYRHPELKELEDNTELPEAEIKAKQNKLSYIKLNGNIGCMVNGAGLAMATMDIIKNAGGEPANFLDVGGGVKQEQVTEAFKIILSDPNVKAILVNIFGGIVHCDVIANGIINAVKEIELKLPLVVRLEGTNVEEGKKILENSKLNIITATTMKSAAEKVVEAAQR